MDPSRREELAGQASEYILGRSWRLRRYPRRVRRLIGAGVFLLMLSDENGLKYTREERTQFLQDSLTEDIEDSVRNPALFLLVAQILLPIIIKYLIQWWENREQEEDESTFVR